MFEFEKKKRIRNNKEETEKETADSERNILYNSNNTDEPCGSMVGIRARS